MEPTESRSTSGGSVTTRRLPYGDVFGQHQGLALHIFGWIPPLVLTSDVDRRIVDDRHVNVGCAPLSSNHREPQRIGVNAPGDGQLPVSGGWDKTVAVRHAAAGQGVYALKGHTDPVYEAAVRSSSGGRHSGSGGNRARPASRARPVEASQPLLRPGPRPSRAGPSSSRVKSATLSRK